MICRDISTAAGEAIAGAMAFHRVFKTLREIREL
jgi:hypothetical protein